MTDPLEAQPGADDEARIEHLLVTGLDHYFAGEFEQAINLWTRVLFLDRKHDRARAYIERARSAQAEQQRISDALVHQGLEAFDKGEVERARALLRDALAQGASHDVALGVLGRIDRLDAGKRAAIPPAATARRRIMARSSASTDAGQRRGAIAMWWVTLATIVLVAGISFVVVTPGGLAEWFAGQATSGAPVLVPAPSPLPVPSPTEAYLNRARALFAGGKLRDALRILDRVPVGDALRPDAERLRADIQRELLALAGAEVSSSPTAATPVSAPKE